MPPGELAATVISYEEQTRGWLGYIARTRSPEDQVAAYGYLQPHLQIFCAVQLLAFDVATAAIVRQLQTQRIRIGTMDLKIASIALAHEASLLTRNVADFRKVPGLRIEDRTARGSKPAATVTVRRGDIGAIRQRRTPRIPLKPSLGASTPAARGYQHS